MADGRRRPWRPHKRSGSRSIQAEENDGDAAGIEIVNLREINSSWTALHNSFNGASTYDVMQPGEKNRLARDLWSEEPLDVAMRQLRADNAPLVELLQAQMSNTSPETEHSVMATQRRIDGILLDVCRGQNMFHIPLVTAMLGFLAEVNGVAREFRDAVTAFHLGATVSEKWIRDNMPMIMAARPGPLFDAIPGVAVACFDNLTMHQDYKSYSSEGEVGTKLDMTNWFYTLLPQYLAAINMDGGTACACTAHPRA